MGEGKVMEARAARPTWVSGLNRFEKPVAWKVLVQLVDTVLPFLGLMVLMYMTVGWGLPYWVTLLIGIPAGAFMLRTFIFFHDCCHGSFVASPLALKVIGNILGVLVLTPFADWRHSHGMHHSTAGNLDRRGIGDVWTMTVDEYAASGWFRKSLYRFYRYPAVMFILGPFLSFVIMNRIPSRDASAARIRSVILTNLALAVIIVAIGLTAGFKAFLMVQLPILLVGGPAGVWLFYVQHQFDPSYWARSEEWESMDAAMRGSSYYKLPRVLQWISGNIGFHHVHHLRPRIPNYNLEQCLRETPELQLPDPLLLWPSLLSVRLKVWDESHKLLLTAREMRQQLRQGHRMATI
jgi:acyl-lipid omega-6 desaturase (Delta-12 desaturase)